MIDFADQKFLAGGILVCAEQELAASASFAPQPDAAKLCLLPIALLRSFVTIMTFPTTVLVVVFSHANAYTSCTLRGAHQHDP